MECPQRSAMALAFGARNGVRTISTPSETKTWSKLVMNEETHGCIGLVQAPDELPRLLSDPSTIGIGRAARQMDAT